MILFVHFSQSLSFSHTLFHCNCNSLFQYFLLLIRLPFELNDFAWETHFNLAFISELIKSVNADYASFAPFASDKLRSIRSTVLCIKLAASSLFRKSVGIFETLNNLRDVNAFCSFLSLALLNGIISDSHINMEWSGTFSQKYSSMGNIQDSLPVG